MNLFTILRSLASKFSPTSMSAFLSGMLYIGRVAWKKLLLVFVVATAVCSVIGVFIPFVSVRSFGMGGGLIITVILWYIAYLATKNESM